MHQNNKILGQTGETAAGLLSEKFEETSTFCIVSGMVIAACRWALHYLHAIACMAHTCHTYYNVASI